jgi:serine/threonine-protein kinase HipA
VATDVFVWAWLPGATSPVVAGRVRRDIVGGRPIHTFQYGRSYIDRSGSIPLFSELPLRAGVQEPQPGLDVAGVLLDATPDSWGRRVINEKVLGSRNRDSEPAELDLITYMLESGSNRIGGLDFQQSETNYVARGLDDTASIEELLHAADLIEAGEELPASLANAILLGSTVGGARPKALIADKGRSLIAKFPSATDQFPYVRYEAVAMDLARRVGLDVANTELHVAADRDVLLVERFDRPGAGTRRMQVSAVTILGKNPEAARGTTSYPDLADKIRAEFKNPNATLRELFGRIVFNVIVRNTDDHARNHAAFWDGSLLTLTPAYDISPSSGRRDSLASHPMAITPGGDHRSLLAVCVRAASVFHLSAVQAQNLIEHQVQIVHDEWRDAAEVARLTNRQRDDMWQTSILNPAIYWEE